MLTLHEINTKIEDTKKRIATLKMICAPAIIIKGEEDLLKRYYNQKAVFFN